MPQHAYTSVAKTLHWLMATLLGSLLVVGFYMHDLPLSPEKLRIYSWHKWAGVTAFVLLLARVAWRVTHKPPALPDTMSTIMRLAAHTGHGVLYLLMLAIPLSGWLMSSAKGFQTVWFGILPIPDLLEKNRELGNTLVQVHKTLNILLILILATHVAAALKHHFIDRDDVLRRMLHGRHPSGGNQ